MKRQEVAEHKVVEKNRTKEIMKTWETKMVIMKIDHKQHEIKGTQEVDHKIQEIDLRQLVNIKAKRDRTKMTIEKLISRRREKP